MDNPGLVGAYASIIMLLLLSAAAKRRTRNRRRKQNKKGLIKSMPVELIKDYIGKKVTIYMEGELGGFIGTILSVESNWLKVEEKKHIRLVNGDMITQIRFVK